MYELIQVAKNTFYMDCPSKCGIYCYNKPFVCLIDGGSDISSAKKMSSLLDSKGFIPTHLLLTHSHADHCGGNAYLKNRYGLKVFGPMPDAALAENGTAQPTTLYGAFPGKEMKTKFFYAEPCRIEPIYDDSVLPKGIKSIDLKGHSLGQKGYITEDDIWFIGDVLASEKTIKKYKTVYLFDIKTQLNTLSELKHFGKHLYIGSHIPPLRTIDDLTDINIKHIDETCDFIIKSSYHPVTVDELLKKFFDENNMILSLSQYLLVGATFRSYISYLCDEGKMEYTIIDNILKFQKKQA